MIISDYLSTSSISGIRKKIIYVDDVKYSRFTIKRKLGEQYEIYTVESAARLFEVIGKIEPDLIILDINMPDMDGYETIIKIKDSERYSKIPVIFISSRDDKESVFKGLTLGAVDYFIKPFDTEKLIESIEKQLDPENKNKIENKEEIRPNVLIIDDITAMLRTIHFSLRNKYNITLLSKSEFVIEYLKENETDLILLDLIMPVINGFDLIPMIKELPNYSNIPIIVISTDGKLDTVSKVLNLGANDFIVKPFAEEELNEKVERNLRTWKQTHRQKAEIEYFLN